MDVGIIKIAEIGTDLTDWTDQNGFLKRSVLIRSIHVIRGLFFPTHSPQGSAKDAGSRQAQQTDPPHQPRTATGQIAQI